MSAQENSRPTLRRGYRLQWEPAQQATVMLYPEGMVQLNGSAAAILTRCDGVRTIDQIVTELHGQFERTDLRDEIVGFLMNAAEHGWLVLE